MFFLLLLLVVVVQALLVLLLFLLLFLIITIIHFDYRLLHNFISCGGPCPGCVVQRQIGTFFRNSRQCPTTG